MSTTNILDKLCQYFGGDYDAETHTYRTPQIVVPNMSGPIVRRSAAKRDDHNTDFHVTYPPPTGVPIGCLILFTIEGGMEKRVAVAGATSGVKQVRHSVRMHCFFRAEVAYVEDAQDALNAFVDAVRARLHADRTCGSGGFEAGYDVGFQVGEGGEPWLRWSVAPISTPSKDLSKGYVRFEFDADEYIQA